MAGSALSRPRRAPLPPASFPCAYLGIDGNVTPTVEGKDFGNYKPATVIVEKQTVPDGAAGSFAFTSTIPGKAAFNLTDGQQNSTTRDPGRLHGDRDGAGRLGTDRHHLLGRHDRAELQ